MLPTLRDLQRPKRPTAQENAFIRSPDLHMPGTSPGGFAHYTRPANSNYKTQLLHYNQAMDGEKNVQHELQLKKGTLIELQQKCVTKADKKNFKDTIRQRVARKLQEFDENVKIRREKLRDLFYAEEREQIKEAIDVAQRGKFTKHEEIAKKAEEIRMKKLHENDDFVHQKRIQQYLEKCPTLRPLAVKLNCQETKICNIQQMREKEAQKEKEKELEEMWHQLIQKEAENFKEREEQEVLETKMKQKELAQVYKKQIQGLQQIREEMKRLREDDRQQMELYAKRIEEEDRMVEEAKRKERQEYAKEIMQQKELVELMVREKKEAEKSWESLFAKLTKEELDREKRRLENATKTFGKDMEMYREYLHKLKLKQQQEESKTDEYLKKFKKQCDEKEADSRCKNILARKKLQEEVLMERKMQLVFKEKQAEFEEQMKEAEKEAYRYVNEQNRKLVQLDKEERCRAALRYRQDLENQIKYANLKKEQQKLEEEKFVQRGIQQDEKYMKQAEELIAQGLQPGTSLAVHPFRRALNWTRCECPNRISSIYLG